MLFFVSAWYYISALLLELNVTHEKLNILISITNLDVKPKVKLKKKKIVISITNLDVKPKVKIKK